MPKTPQVSGREVVSALTRIGFEVKRQTGSHIIMHRGERVIPVPNHKVVAKGTLHSIIKAAGLTLQEFIDLL